MIVGLILTTSISAQVPQRMSYQAVIRDAGDNLVTNQSVGIQISILQNSQTGNSVYTEKHTTTTNTNGLVSLEIGTGTSVSGTFSSIDWSTGAYFIKTETDPTGGENYTISGVSQLMSVPYALYAENSGNNSTNNDPSTASTSFQVKPVSFLVFENDNGNHIVHAYSSQTGTWASQTTSANSTSNTFRVSGNFLVNDTNAGVIYGFCGRTGSWTSQIASVDSSNVYYLNANGNFLVNDSSSNKVYAFNGQTGVWTTQALSSPASTIYITVD